MAANCRDRTAQTTLHQFYKSILHQIFPLTIYELLWKNEDSGAEWRHLP